MEWLWTGDGEPPWVYVEFKLCQLYHCLPSELAEENLLTILRHMVCLQAEAQVRKLEEEHG